LSKFAFSITLFNKKYLIFGVFINSYRVEIYLP
jgi:hypothetical protein